METVSIIIPCYNGGKYIKDCLNSLLNQTYKQLQIIIVDDGSTDNSYEILKSFETKFEDNKILYTLLQQSNQGAAAAINYALKLVSGSYLMWMDIDDTLEFDAVENLYNFLKKNTKFPLVRGNVAYCNEDMTKILGYGKSVLPNDFNAFDKYIFEYDSYCYAGIFMVKMNHLDKCIKNRDIYISKAGQNWQLILPITYNVKCGYIDKLIYYYRITDNSHSHSVKTLSELLKRADNHKDILLNVLKNMTIEDNVKNFYIRKIKRKYIKVKKRIYVDYSKTVVKKLIKRI